MHPVNIYNSNCYSLDTSEWTYKEISIGIGAEKESNKSLPEALRTQLMDEFVRHQPLICKLHSIVYGDSIRYDYEYDFNLLFNVQNCRSYDYQFWQQVRLLLALWNKLAYSKRQMMMSCYDQAFLKLKQADS